MLEKVLERFDIVATIGDAEIFQKGIWNGSKSHCVDPVLEQGLDRIPWIPRKNPGIAPIRILAGRPQENVRNDSVDKVLEHLKTFSKLQAFSLAPKPSLACRFKVFWPPSGEVS